MACRDSDPSPAKPPEAEFLFAAGDSTWWVRSGAEGVRVRSAPILLTFTEGKFYEIFVSEDGTEFENASLASARVYSRDVLEKDSLLIFEDPTARREIARWKRAHPNAQKLAPEDELDAEEPSTAITDEIEVIDVHGPWVTVQHSLDIDVEGRAGHRHTRRRAVLDVRTGRRASLATLFGAQASGNAIRAGRTALEALKDSVRGALGDERADRARETLESFRFDVTSFALSDLGRSPAISFTVPGNDADGSAIVLTLPPFAMPPQPWWHEVLATLPKWAADSASVRWERPKYIVRAMPVGDGSALALVVRARDTTNAAATREWELATVLSPAYQLIALDDKPVSNDLRTALSRAFDAASAVDGLGQRVSRKVTPLAPGKVVLRRAVYVAPTARRATRQLRHD